MSENPSRRNPRRQETPVEIRDQREENYEGLRGDVQNFIDATYDKLKQHPGMLKDGQGVRKHEKMPLWGTGNFHCSVDLYYTEGSSSRGGRPRKEGT